MEQPTLNEVTAVAVEARGWAQGVSDRRLDRKVRQLSHRDDLTDLDLARLVAYRNEQRVRQ